MKAVSVELVAREALSVVFGQRKGEGGDVRNALLGQLVGVNAVTETGTSCSVLRAAAQ